MHYALAYEIKHWKTIGGSKISIMNGRFIYTDYESICISAYFEVSLPEGSPFELSSMVRKRQKYYLYMD